MNSNKFEKLYKILVCPVCHVKVELVKDLLVCSYCGRQFQFYDGIPLMLDSPADYSSLYFGSKRIKRKFGILHPIVKLLTPPNLVINTGIAKNLETVKNLMTQRPNNPIGLMVGGGTDELCIHADKLGERLLDNCINLDILPGSKVDIIGDAHSIPLANESVDFVIAVAVFEHVREPAKVVAEIYRVLKRGGIIYVDVPFIQGLHSAPYDFQRFTLYGLEQLLKDFKKINAGVTTGPSSGFVWILRDYLALLFSFNSRLLFQLMRVPFGWLTFGLKYFDFILTRYKNAIYIPSGVFYIGSK